ncbi:MAG: DAK2 domain-containing protein [Chloroflexi bacterium]|nr:DAK2 domain-containing protein [Chloroflexota bacterium]
MGDSLTDKSPSAQSIRFCDGQTLRQVFQASTVWLEKHVALVNSLNVYPVPDGDTGTNMFLTAQAAGKELNGCADNSASGVVKALAHGALMGARGNSGVIFSQILRGMARSLDAKETMTAADLALALEEGAATAYKGVIKPVEGTILTVVREAAAAATSAAKEHDDLGYVLEQVVSAARESVARTPTLLAVLREAGVVDAGGQGLFVLFEGALRFLHGEALEATPELAVAADIGAPAGGYGYDVQFVIQGQSLHVEAIRARIAAMGESTLVVGDDTAVKVHVHVPEPGPVLDYGASLGHLSKVTVEDMQAQYQQLYHAAPAPVVPLPPPAPVPTGNVAIVAVASGEGLSRVLQSLGASRIVPGGQTMNPATEDILQAIEDVTADQVIVLPNNKNIVLAAQQTRELTKKQVAIVPTHTIPQGVAALLAFNYGADLETNCQAMERAIAHVQTGEVTTAVRNTHVNGLQIQAGAVIGLLNGMLTATGISTEAVVYSLLEQMAAQEREIITLYYGQGVAPSQAEALRQEIQQRYSRQEVELVDGGQPHYSFIISVE